jgi:hypothetical protein
MPFPGSRAVSLPDLGFVARVLRMPISISSLVEATSTVQQKFQGVTVDREHAWNAE